MRNKKHRALKTIKSKPRLTSTFPSDSLIWEAHRKCCQAFQDDPTPVNRAIAHVLSEKWNDVFLL